MPPRIQVILGRGCCPKKKPILDKSWCLYKFKQFIFHLLEQNLKKFRYNGKSDLEEAEVKRFCKGRKHIGF